MKTAWQRTVLPTIEPIELADALDHLRISDTANVPAAERAIRGARGWAEEYLQRGLLTQTWKYAQDDWTDEIQLPMAAPLQSVTSVKYYDAAGVLTTLSASVYQVDALSEPARIYRAPQQVWPVLQANRPMAVEIIYVVGWSALTAIPANIVDGLYLLLGDRYEHREQTVAGTITATLPMNAEWSLAPSRVWWSAPCNAWSQDAAVASSY